MDYPSTTGSWVHLLRGLRRWEYGVGPGEARVRPMACARAVLTTAALRPIVMGAGQRSSGRPPSIPESDDAMNRRRWFPLSIGAVLALSACASAAEPASVVVGVESRIPPDPRQDYARYVRFRPGDGRITSPWSR